MSETTGAELGAHSQAATELLRTLANQHRLVVCCRLLDGEQTVSELNGDLDLSQSALSQHLAVLREAGVVTFRREGQHVRYALAAGPAVDVIHALHAAYCSPRRA